MYIYIHMCIYICIYIEMNASDNRNAEDVERVLGGMAGNMYVCERERETVFVCVCVCVCVFVCVCVYVYIHVIGNSAITSYFLPKSQMPKQGTAAGGGGGVHSGGVVGGVLRLKSLF